MINFVETLSVIRIKNELINDFSAVSQVYVYEYDSNTSLYYQKLKMLLGKNFPTRDILKVSSLKNIFYASTY